MSASLKKSPTFLSHDDEHVTVMPMKFGRRKLESTTKDGSGLGVENEEKELQELKVIIVVGGDAEYIKKFMNGVKVTKIVVGAIQVGHNIRHVCLTEGVCLVARASTGSAVQKQCSSAADKGWRFVPDAMLPRHRRAHQWVPASTLGPQ